MKNRIVLLGLLLLVACHQVSKNTETNAPAPHPRSTARAVDGNGGSEFISVDSANRMIQSYLTSINPDVNDRALQSLVIDADSLRAYLNDASNDSVRYVKLMFAHTLDYINSGNEGKRVDSNSNDITLVVAGVNEQGDYTFHGGKVLDHCFPCPNQCFLTGSATNNTIGK